MVQPWATVHDHDRLTGPGDLVEEARVLKAQQPLASHRRRGLRYRKAYSRKNCHQDTESHHTPDHSALSVDSPIATTFDNL